MAKKSYEVLSHVTHDGKGYDVGKTIELDDEHAEPLLAVKAIGEAGTKKAGKKVRVTADGDTAEAGEE